MPAEPIRTEISSDATEYISGPTSGDAGTEGGTTKDGAVAKFPRQASVRATDNTGDAGTSES